jgi:hypothetical protein
VVKNAVADAELRSPEQSTVSFYSCSAHKPLNWCNKSGGFMSRLHQYDEHHLVARAGWLCAAVSGANDGVVSTASLIVGAALRTVGDPGRQRSDRRPRP